MSGDFSQKDCAISKDPGRLARPQGERHQAPEQAFLQVESLLSGISTTSIKA